MSGFLLALMPSKESLYIVIEFELILKKTLCIILLAKLVLEKKVKSSPILQSNTPVQ